MPLSKPTPCTTLKVPSKVSISDSTIIAMRLNSTKYQYSARLDLPLNTAYFLSTSRYQLTRHPNSLADHSWGQLSTVGWTACAKKDTVRRIDPHYRNQEDITAVAMTGSWPRRR